MTSRRSRLKAVTNLPVRRKTSGLQGNGNEATSADLTSEKVFPCGPNSDEIISPAYNEQSSQSVEQTLFELPKKNTANEHSDANCVVDFMNSVNSENESVTSRKVSTDDSEIPETINNVVKSCNLISCKADINSDPLFRSSKRYKPNLVSPITRDRAKLQTPVIIREKESLPEENFVVNDTCINGKNNNNNNIIEDGFKCYAVLTPQNVPVTPLADYTITPLTPCENAYIDSALNDLVSSQEYEEVEIFTEVEEAEIYCNEVNENCNSVIESEVLEPVLTNYNNEEEENNINFESLSSNYAQLKNSSENVILKSIFKNKKPNVKTSLIGNNETFKNSVSQSRDSHILENTISSNLQNVPSDSHPYKQNISTIRRKRSKCSDFTKKLADAKKEFQKKYEKTKPDRSTLKMIDLIFYNPTTNPMESKAKFEKKDSTGTHPELTHDLLAEEKVDEPESLDYNSTSGLPDSCEMENLNKMPVPQVKIGLDGEIILDEKSLIIETTDAKRGREELQNSVPIFEDRGCKVSYYRGKSKKTRDWADFETKRFYKALNTIGPDFSLMQKYFPKRSRLELKNKFKREERLNRSLVDKALNNPSEFDMTQLEKDLAVEKEEEEIEMRLCRIIKQTTKKPNVKSSLLSREIIESDVESENSQSHSKKFMENEKNKKSREFDFVLQKLLMKESEKCHSVLPEISSPSHNMFQQSDHGVT